ncbi:MAG: hypothetical protein GX947_10560 [Tissierellia bacterium]|nr:hypothetical protein [Tissierellia bacterium]
MNGNNNTSGNKIWKVAFKELPTSVSMLKALPEANLKEPHFAAALLIPALCMWPKDQKVAIDMINFLKGPQGLSTRDIQFINERFRGKEYLPYSYFEGSSPANGYKASIPYTVTISTVPSSFDEEGYAKLYLKSSGADSPRPVQVRKKDSSGEWFLWDQMLLSEIRVPVSSDAWA